MIESNEILIKIGIGASVALNLFIIGVTSYVWLNARKKDLTKTESLLKILLSRRFTNR